MRHGLVENDFALESRYKPLTLGPNPPIRAPSQLGPQMEGPVHEHQLTMMGGHGILKKPLLLVWNKRWGDAYDIPHLKCKQKQLIFICQRLVTLPMNPKLQTWSKRNQSWMQCKLLCTMRRWSTGPTPRQSFYDIRSFLQSIICTQQQLSLPLVDKSWDHGPIICHSD